MGYPFWDEELAQPRGPEPGPGVAQPSKPEAAGRSLLDSLAGFSLPRGAVRKALPLAFLAAAFTLSWLWMPVGNTWWVASLGSSNTVNTGQFPGDQHGCPFRLTAHGLWQVWEILFPDRPPDLFREIVGVHGQVCLEGAYEGNLDDLDVDGWIEFFTPGGSYQRLPGAGFGFPGRHLGSGCLDYRVEFQPIPGAHYRVITQIRQGHGMRSFNGEGASEEPVLEEQIVEFDLPGEPEVVEQINVTPTSAPSETITPTLTETPTELPSGTPTPAPTEDLTEVPTTSPTPTQTVTPLEPGETATPSAPAPTDTATPTGQPETNPSSTPTPVSVPATPTTAPTEEPAQPPTATPTSPPVEPTPVPDTPTPQPTAVPEEPTAQPVVEEPPQDPPDG